MNEGLRRYWSTGAEGYSKIVQEGMSRQHENRGWQDVFTETLGKDRLNILDVGTGPGVVAFQLAQLGHHVTGVDFSEEMLSEARRNARLYNWKSSSRRAMRKPSPSPMERSMPL